MDKYIEKCLIKSYRKAGFKQFHTMHAAVKDMGVYKLLYSYYTCTVGVLANTYDGYAYVCVEPFIYDPCSFGGKSCTTDKQADRFFRENGFDFYVSQLRDIYRLAKFGHTSYPISMQDGRLVVPIFLQYQYYLEPTGKESSNKHTTEVPHMKYSYSKTELISDGRMYHGQVLRV